MASALGRSSLTARNPYFIWDDGAAVFLDSISKTVLLERTASLALQHLLHELLAPDVVALRAWLVGRVGEASIEADFDAFYATLMEIHDQLDAGPEGV